MLTGPVLVSSQGDFRDKKRELYRRLPQCPLSGQAVDAVYLGLRARP